MCRSLAIHKLLLPALFAATDASSSHEKARIVTVSSSANYLTNGIDFDALRMALSGKSTVNGSCTTRVNSCVEPNYSQSAFLNQLCRRVTSWWRASWRGGMVTRSCPQVCIPEIFAQVFSDTCLGGKTLYLCVPSSFTFRRRR